MFNDSKNKQGTSYLGNPNIKRDGVQEEWTPEMVLEYKKCSEDPVYFIQKYIKVISLDEGLVPFELYPYQRKMINHFHSNNFSCVLSCRQSGKCLSSDTKIKIRNKRTGEIKEIEIGEFHEVVIQSN